MDLERPSFAKTSVPLTHHFAAADQARAVQEIAVTGATRVRGGTKLMGPVPVRTGCVALWTSNSPDREVVGWLFDVNGRTMGSGSASC